MAQHTASEAVDPLRCGAVKPAWQQQAVTICEKGLAETFEVRRSLPVGLRKGAVRGVANLQVAVHVVVLMQEVQSLQHIPGYDRQQGLILCMCSIDFLLHNDLKRHRRETAVPFAQRCMVHGIQELFSAHFAAAHHSALPLHRCMMLLLLLLLRPASPHTYLVQQCMPAMIMQWRGALALQTCVGHLLVLVKRLGTLSGAHHATVEMGLQNLFQRPA